MHIETKKVKLYTWPLVQPIQLAAKMIVANIHEPKDNPEPQAVHHT